MFWSRPKPWDSTTVGICASPVTVTWFLRTMSRPGSLSIPVNIL